MCFDYSILYTNVNCKYIENGIFVILDIIANRRYKYISLMNGRASCIIVVIKDILTLVK